jgi:hypothetical protein
MLATVSPMFTYYLLRYVCILSLRFSLSELINPGQVSGVPPLERSNKKKFRDDPQWAEYKRLVPFGLHR